MDCGRRKQLFHSNIIKRYSASYVELKRAAKDRKYRKSIIVAVLGSNSKMILSFICSEIPIIVSFWNGKNRNGLVD